MEGLFEGILEGLLREKGYARAYEVPADINVPVGFIRTQQGNIVPDKITVYDFIDRKIKKVERLYIPWKKVYKKFKNNTLLHVYENIVSIYVYYDRVGFITALPQESFIILYSERVVGHVTPDKFSTYKTNKICTKERARQNFDIGKESPRHVPLGALVALAKYIRNDNDGFVSYVGLELNHMKPIKAFYEDIWPHNVELIGHRANCDHRDAWFEFKEKGLIIKKLSVLEDISFFELFNKNKLDVNEDTLLNYGIKFIYADDVDELIDSGMKPSYIKNELYK